MPRMTSAEVDAYNRKHADASAASIIQGAPTQSRDERMESEIQDEIETWLRIQSHRCWWHRSRMDKPTTARVGVPDFLICFEGWFIGIEVKRPGKKPTIEQRGELAWIRKAGGIECVATSLHEVQCLIQLLEERRKFTKANTVEIPKPENS